MQMQVLSHSGVWLPHFRTWVRHWSLRRKIWISHWPNVQPPSHSQSLRQFLCGCFGEHQIAGSDWLVCQTTSVCNNPFTCTVWILARAFFAYICFDVTRTAILNLGPFGRWTPGRVRLPAEPAFCPFGNTLCGRSHGDQHKTASPHTVNPLIMNVWL